MLVSLSVAALLAAMFTFRFRTWQHPLWGLAYFTLFAVVESVAQNVFLPAGTLPNEIAFICLPLAAIFVALTFALRKYEADNPSRP